DVPQLLRKRRRRLLAIEGLPIRSDGFVVFVAKEERAALSKKKGSIAGHLGKNRRPQDRFQRSLIRLLESRLGNMDICVDVVLHQAAEEIPLFHCEAVCFRDHVFQHGHFADRGLPDRGELKWTARRDSPAKDFAAAVESGSSFYRLEC